MLSPAIWRQNVRFCIEKKKIQVHTYHVPSCGLALYLLGTKQSPCSLLYCVSSSRREYQSTRSLLDQTNPSLSKALARSTVILLWLPSIIRLYWVLCLLTQVPLFVDSVYSKGNNESREHCYRYYVCGIAHKWEKHLPNCGFCGNLLGTRQSPYFCLYCRSSSSLSCQSTWSHIDHTIPNSSNAWIRSWFMVDGLFSRYNLYCAEGERKKWWHNNIVIKNGRVIEEIV
jgi:hypothetical protein